MLHLAEGVRRRQSGSDSKNQSVKVERFSVYKKVKTTK